MKPTTLKLLTALLMAAAPAARKFEARRGCRRTAETLRALLRQAARQMQTVSRCVALLIFMAMAADAQTYALRFIPSSQPASVTAYKFWLTPDTNPPAAGTAYTISTLSGTNLCVIPSPLWSAYAPGQTVGYWWGASTFTNSTGYHDTAFTNASFCPFTLPVDGAATNDPDAPTGLGVIRLTP